MTTLEKLVDVDVNDVVTMAVAALLVEIMFTNGLNAGGVVGVIIGNRIMSVLMK
jgi:hypothetical protein